ncbi:MAG TPA: hypothetical protein VJM74_02450 [Nitrososphaeraceae archaeon]|nr:hypothetical protein [Nitrososphaeraceae archaeon]
MLRSGDLIISVLEIIEASYCAQKVTEKMGYKEMSSLLIFSKGNKPLGIITERQMPRNLDQVKSKIPE